MKPNPKKPSVYPSQFIEDLIKYHDPNDKDPISLDIRKFQHIIDELKSTYNVPFEYFELVNYVKRFNRPLIIIEEMEIHLNPQWFKKIQEHLECYNRMYKLNEHIVSGQISNVWKKFK